MIRIRSSRSVWITTSVRPRCDWPAMTNRSSYEGCRGSLMVKENGSAKTVVASENDTPRVPPLRRGPGAVRESVPDDREYILFTICSTRVERACCEFVLIRAGIDRMGPSDESVARTGGWIE